MNISYKWLKDYIDLPISPEELEDKLTFAGIEVEKVMHLGQDLKSIVVAEVIEKEKHPNADSLSVCKVNDGKNIIQVVCGAPNCRAGLKVALAPVGTKIGDFKIKKAKIRGVESFGMLCSEKELDISDNHDGIMELEVDSIVGTDLPSHLGMSDVVFEVEITPNRPDLLGMIGVARDLSALLEIPVKAPDRMFQSGKNKIADMLKLENIEKDFCPRYTARIIENVMVDESPEWLKNKLIAAGLRPINNIVDITNFVMLEYGHPLHAFDYNKIKDKKIIVRKANENEKFIGLDDETYKLHPEDLVIADSEKPIALAGVMGSQNSHITEDTKTIVIEAANFIYSSVRRTSNRHKIFTDSSYRFERGMSSEIAEVVSERATHLVLQIAGGELVDGVLDSYPDSKEKNKVSIRPSRVTKLFTIKLSNEQIISYLTKLGLTLLEDSGDSILFEIPSYRNDLTREIDLLEEIIRLHGYNDIKEKLSINEITNETSLYARRKIKDYLVSNGFYEMINLSYSNPENMNRLNLSDNDYRRKPVKIMNPMGISFSTLRTTLLPDLLRNALYNINHGQKDLKIFELNKVYSRDNQKLATEEYRVTGLLTGLNKDIHWSEKNESVNFYDAKGIIEDIFGLLFLEKYNFETVEQKYFQPGMAAEIFSGKIKIGEIGKLDQKTIINFGIDQPVYMFDISLDMILNTKKNKPVKYEALSLQPFVNRDLSFIISKAHSCKEVVDVILSSNRKLIKKVTLIDEFTGKRIPEGYRSLTFNLLIGDNTKTLTDEGTNLVLEKIFKNLKKRFEIEMR